MFDSVYYRFVVSSWEEKCYCLIGFLADYKFIENKFNGNAKKGQYHSTNNMVFLIQIDEVGDEVICSSISQISISKDQIHKLMSIINEQPSSINHDNPTTSNQQSKTAMVNSTLAIKFCKYSCFSLNTSSPYSFMNNVHA